MTQGNDRRTDVTSAQTSDVTSASDFLGVNGVGRRDVLDAFKLLADLGIEALPNLIFVKDEINFIDTERTARLITGASTTLSAIGGRIATPEEVEKRTTVKLNADAMTAVQFRQVVQDFLDFLVTEDFAIISTFSDDRVDVKVAWE